MDYANVITTMYITLQLKDQQVSFLLGVIFYLCSWVEQTMAVQEAQCSEAVYSFSVLDKLVRIKNAAS